MLLGDFSKAIQHAKDRAGGHFVGDTGSLEMLLTDLFTEMDQIDFVKEFLIEGRRMGWMMWCGMM